MPKPLDTPVSVAITVSVAVISPRGMTVSTVLARDEDLLRAAADAHTGGTQLAPWLVSLMGVGWQRLDDYTAWVLNWAGGRPVGAVERKLDDLREVPTNGVTET